MIEQYFIYIGRDKEGLYCYKTFLNKERNNGDAFNSDKISCFKSPLWKCKIIGAIFPSTKESVEDSTFNYNPKALPINYWLNSDDKRKWQVTDKAAELYRKDLKEGSLNIYKDELSKLKEVYKNADYRLKPLILAEFISFITSS